MIRVVVLDSQPAGFIAHPATTQEIVDCKAWVADLVAHNIRVVLPEIVDYELRRELLRVNRLKSIGLLDAFNQAAPDRYLPLTTEVMRRASELWAQVRQEGMPTADPKALDVILAAQDLSLGLRPDEFVVATSNSAHLSRFVPADEWRNIQP